MRAVPGTVYLVGAGPGDPGLITVRGLSLLRQADVVVHDRLIGPELLREARPEAEVIDVGKSPGDERDIQPEINAMLLERSRRGLSVVRLKGGDPFIFGRGFEELTACREAGVSCVVIPGVSSAIAAPEAAGIPITHRGLVRTLAVVTGHVSSVHPRPMDYRALAAMDAIVILMGRATLGEIASSLMSAGLDPSTPAACIAKATTPEQRVVVATVGAIADAVEREGLPAPAVTVIGKVAAFAASSDTAACWTQMAGGTPAQGE
jgi:uroporphyrin-III C-methyltransferase